MGLSFLSPMLLGGAALVAVPFVLHLIMRRKPVKREFPALRFLRQRAVANRRRLRLNHILLLLLRMAAIALLALALARPVLRGAGWLASGEGPVAAAFVFDTAPRMLLREGNRTRLEQATAMAKVLFAKLPSGSKVAVLDTAGGAAVFSPTVAAAAARIDRLDVATPAASLSTSLVSATRLLEQAELSRREIYVFTDCSHGGWDNATPLDLATTHPDVSLLVVDVGAVEPRNFAIDSLELSADRISTGAPLSISVTATRSGTDGTRSVAVELLGPDGRYVRRAVKPVTWRSARAGHADFELTGLEPGVRQGRVIIDGQDDLEADDVRSFTVAVGAADRILVAAAAPAAKTGMLLTQAIAPVTLAKAGKAAFDVAVVDLGQMEKASWDDFRGLVLLDPPPLPARTWEMLGDWVAAGHGLVIWLGPQAAAAERFNSAASERVLGGRLVRVWRTADGGNFLAPAALDHPILAGFRRVGDAVPWQDFPVARHWEFEAAAAADDGKAAAQVVAAYRNGLPAVLEHRVGQGTVVVVTTPVSQGAAEADSWNTLATGFEPWPFVMLANETLLHAIDTADDLNVPAGRPVVLHVARRDVPAAFVRSPAGDEFPAAVDQARGTITITATQTPGNYAVRAGGEAAGIATGFSANLGPAAIDFHRLPADALAAVCGPGHRLARTEAELVRDVNLERVGVELYGWIILLVAAVMAGDWIMANRFYAPRDGQDVGPGPSAEFARASAAHAESPRARQAARRPDEPPPLPVELAEEVDA
jgi:hypothetical protein